MAKRGRPRKLDDIKKREIVAVLTAGFTRQMAADYVGCSMPTLLNTAARDRHFAHQLREAEMKHQLHQLQTIDRAGQRSWKASAWLLERRNPGDFARQPPEALTPDDLRAAAAFVAELAIGGLPASERKRLWDRIDGHLETFLRRRLALDRIPYRAARRRRADRLFAELKPWSGFQAGGGSNHEQAPDANSPVTDVTAESIDRNSDPAVQSMSEIRSIYLRSQLEQTAENKTPERQPGENNSEFL